MKNVRVVGGNLVNIQNCIQVVSDDSLKLREVEAQTKLYCALAMEEKF